MPDAGLGDVDRIITMLVGDTQRITAYADQGYAIPQEIPANVEQAYTRLVNEGFTARLI
jgi:hypothetical protein